MADRYTTARSNQIKDGTITEDDLNASVAGNGLTGGAGSALALDFNELTEAAIDVANDFFTIEDVTDNSSKKESIADLITAIAGDGLAASSGVLAIDLNELTAAVIDVSADEIPFIDATDNSTKKESIVDIISATAGVGLAASAGVLAIDLNELNTEATFDPTADFVPMVDATDSSSDKALWSVIATAIAGSGITATNGVLSVSAAADAIVEGDFTDDDFTATLDGIETDFVLTDIPLVKSLAVYINGKFGIEGSGKDYELNPDSGQTKTIRIAGDELVSGERLFVQYVIDN